MNELLARIAAEARTATTVGLAAGLVVGIALGVSLVSLEYVDLLFETTVKRMAAVALLASLASLASAVCLVPLAFGVAAAVRFGWPLKRSPGVRFYAVSYLTGGLFIHAFLLLAYRHQRDLLTPRGLIWTAILALAALALHWLLSRLWAAYASGPSRTLAGRWVAVGVAVLATLAAGSYRVLSLAAGPDAMAEARSAEVLASAAGPASDLHNVLLISIDTLRPDHLGAYGYHRPTSPHLDELAGCGTRFANARSPAPWTLPAHASMLTSLYPASHGARFRENSLFLPYAVVDRLDEDHLTLAEILKTAGMRTAAFTANAFLSRELGFAQGFERFESDRQPSADAIVAKAIGWLRQPSPRPFFLFLHFIDVHDYQAPEEFLELYAPPAYDGKLGRPSFALHPIVANLYQDLEPADLDYLTARYDGAIRYVDDRLGSLFTWLKDRGVYDDTAIVVTSDHGEELWEHGGTGHGYTLYEEQLRVPLIFKPAGGDGECPPSSARVVAADVTLIDVLPTILDDLGLALPAAFEGLALGPLIAGEAPPPRRLFAGSTSFFNSGAVIDGDLKLISHRIPPQRLLDPAFLVANVRAFYKFRDDEAYRLTADGREPRDRSRLEPEVGERLRGELRAHLRGAANRRAVALDPEMTDRLRALGYLP